MLESIWYFILFFAVGVFLPLLAIWALVKLFLHFFGKSAARHGRKAERNIEDGKAAFIAEAENETERLRTAYFLSHSEKDLPDREMLALRRRMRDGIRDAAVEKPGMEKIVDHEGRVVDDGRCLHRRLPSTDIISSKYRRILIFFSDEDIALETIEADLISETVTEKELLIPTDRILEVTAPKWTPPIHVDGHLERGTSWSLKFLMKGGTAKVVKGFPDDPKEVAERLNEKIREATGRE